MHSCVAARGQSASEPWARASCAACAPLPRRLHLHAAPPPLPPYRRALRAPRSSSHRPRARPSPPAARARAGRPRLLHRFFRHTRSFSTACSTEGRPTTTYRARALIPRFTTSAFAVSTRLSWRTGRAARERRTPWRARAASTGRGLFRGRVNSFRTPLSRHPFLLPSDPMTPSTPWHITHHPAGCRARRRLPRGHGVATRALRRHHGRRRALPRSLPRPAQLERTR